MTTRPPPPLPPPAVSRPASVDLLWQRVAGGLTVLIALTVAVGWVADIPALITLAPGGTPMVMNTAVSILLCGLGWLALSGGYNRVAGLMGALAMGLCLWILGGAVLGLSLGADDFFWSHQYAAALMPPGRMAWPAALSLLLVGLALLLHATGRSQHWLLSAIGGVVLAFALLPLLHYSSIWLLGKGDAVYRNFAIPTAGSFLLFALVILRGTNAAGKTAQSFIVSAVILLGAIGLQSALSNSEMIAANHGVVRTYRVRGDIDFFISEIARMESSARAYALTGTESFAERYAYHRDQVTKLLLELRPVVADHPRQLQRVDQLRVLAEQKFTQSEALLRIRRTNGVAAAADYLANQPTAVTSALVNLAGELQEDEQRQLALRLKEQKTVEESVRIIQLLGSLLALGLMGQSFVLTRRATAAREKAEGALRELNETLEQRVVERTRSLRFLADAMPQLVWTLGPDGKSESYNQGWCEYTGITEEQGKANGWMKALHPDDLPGVLAGSDGMLRNGVEFGGEYRLRRARDGAWRWHLWRARPERGPDGRIIRWIGTSTDIHEQKAQHEVLEQRVNERTAQLASMTRFQRAVLDGTTFSVIATDPTGLITEFNLGAEIMLGYKRDDMVGRQTPALLHVREEVAARAVELGRELGRPFEPGFEVFVARSNLNQVEEREWTYVRQDGHRLPVWLSVTALRDATGVITGYLGIAHDLTERKQLEAAREENLHRLAKLSSQVPGMIYQFRLRPDGHTSFPYASEGIRDIYRLAPDEVREDGAKVFTVLHPDDAAAVSDSIQASARTLQAWRCEYRVRFADDTERWLLGNSMPEREADGSVLWHGFITDITQLKRVEQESRINEERVRLAAVVAEVGVWEWKLDSNQLTWDAQMFALHGLPTTPDGLVEYATWAGTLMPEELSRQEAIMRDTITQRGRSQREFVIRRASDQARRVIQAAEMVICNPAGEPVRMVGVNRDITELRQIEAGLRASEERLTLLNKSLVELNQSRSHKAYNRQESFWRFTATLSRTLRVERASIWLVTNEGLECQGLFVATGSLFTSGTRLQVKDYPSYFRALETERLIAAHDALTDPRTAEFAEGYLRPLGITAMLDVPFHLGGRLAGVVCIEHTGSRRKWELDEQSFAGSVADMVQVELETENRREAEQRLRESEQRLTNVYRAMAEGLVLQDASGHISECNPAAERILGLTRDQILGRTSTDPLWQTIHADGRPFPGDTHPVVQTLRTGLAQHDVIMGVKKPNGDLTWIAINSEPSLGPDGRVEFVVCTFADITAQKLAGQEMEKLALIANRTTNAVLLTDAQRRIEWVNEGFTRMSGYTLAEVRGRVPGHFLQGKDTDPAVVAQMRQHLARGEGFRVQLKNYNKAGQEYWISTEVQPLRNASGEIEGYMAIQLDITEQKQLEQSLALARDQALEASRLKSEFLANMSHEIRTPMNGIIGMSELLMDTPLATAQREMGQVIQSSAENLLTIINDILDFSKIEAGKLRVEAQAFALEPLMDEVLSLLAIRAQQKQLRLRIDFDERLKPKLLGDAGRIRQVLLNLVGNAIKFTASGEVVVAARWLAETGQRLRVRIEVQDTGIGIPAASQRLLFQPFIQADGSTTRRYGGTGLGLAICRQLVELMGGEIGLSSAEGRGSCFWFELELDLALPTEPELQSVTPLPGSASRAPFAAHVLVAEDNTTNQLVVRGLLGKMGIQMDFAHDGAEALQLLAKNHYDAVLMDCQMPVMDGYMATRQIRAGAVPGLNPRITVIALTAYAMPSDRQKCIEAGMDDYIPKPLRAEALQQALERCGLIRSTTVPSVSSAVPRNDVLDATQLQQLRDLPGRDHATLLQDIATIFLRETPAALATLHEFASQQDAPAVIRLAHRLAGSCANLGAQTMRQIAAEVEQLADQARWTDLPARLSTLDREWKRVQSALQQLLTHPNP